MKRQECQNTSSAANIMDAKSAAVGAARIAAAAAGVGTGGMEDPLEDVRDIFTTLGMTKTHCDGMINAHNLMGMDDFDSIRVNDAG